MWSPLVANKTQGYPDPYGPYPLPLELEMPPGSHPLHPTDLWSSWGVNFCGRLVLQKSSLRRMSFMKCVWRTHECISGLIYTSTHGTYTSYKRLILPFPVLFLVFNKADWFLSTHPFLKGHFLLQSSPSSFIPDDQWEKKIDNCPTFKLGNCKYHSLP